MPLKIPEQHKEPLSWLLKLSEADAAVLLEALAHSAPTLSPEVLVDQVIQRTEHPARTLRGVIAMLISLMITREHYNFSKEQLVNDLLSAAESEKIGPSSVPNVDRDVLRDRLISFLSLERPLGVTSRASDVMMRHKNVFESARVLSDVRYVFASSESLEPVAGLIIHNLQITSITDDERSSHFVALDSTDLRQLQQVIERAVRKEEALRKAIEVSGYSFMPAEAE